MPPATHAPPEDDLEAFLASKKAAESKPQAPSAVKKNLLSQRGPGAPA